MAQTTRATAPDWAVKSLQTLEEVSAGIYPAIVRTEKYGTAAALEDSGALGGVKVMTTGPARPTGTSNREVTVQYLKRDHTDANNIRYDWTCTDEADTPETFAYNNTTVEDFVQEGFAVAPRNYDDLSYRSTGEDLAEKMYSAVLKMYRSYNNKLTAKALAAAGNYFAETGGAAAVSSLTTPTNLPIFTAETPTRPQPMAMHLLMHQYERMGVGGMPIYMLGGSSKWDAYVFAENIYRGSYEEGRDPNKGFSAFDARAYTDYYVDTYGNANDIGGLTDFARLLSWVPGTFKVLDWYEFDNPLKHHDAGSQIATAFAPVQHSATLYRGKMDVGSAFFGRPFVVDVEIRYDECDGPGGKVVYKLQKDFDLWVIPQDAFSTSYNQFHNYCLLWGLSGADLTFANL